MALTATAHPSPTPRRARCRLLTRGTALVSALALPVLAGCSALPGSSEDPGPGALDQKATEKVLLPAKEVPVKGMERGEVHTGVENPQPFDEKNLPKDLDEDCRSAIKDFSTLKHKEYLSSSSSAVYSGGEKSVVLQVAGTAKEPSKLLDATTALDACPKVTSSASGVEVTNRFDSFEDGEVRGVRVRSDAGGQSTEEFMGGRTVGDNVVYAVGQGMSQDEIVRVVDAQADALESVQDH